jgi:hypothetical protein
LLNIFLTGSERTINIKETLDRLHKRGLGILISFQVPFTINLLNQEKKIWNLVTIFSIVTWFNVMDIGLGNGLK